MAHDKNKSTQRQTRTSKPLLATMRIHRSRDPDINVPEYSIFTHLHQHGRHDPNQLAYADATTGDTLSREEVKSLALSFAFGIRVELPRLGGPVLKRGDTVLVFSPNCLAYPFIVHGLIAAGLRGTFANSAYTPRELEHQTRDSGANLAIVHPSLLNIYRQCLSSERQSRGFTIVSMDWGSKDEGRGAAVLDPRLVRMRDLLGKGSLQTEEKFDGVLSHETAIIGYSSGTTGKPKGVETSHKNLVAQITLLKKYFPAQPGDVMIGTLPMYHVYGAVTYMFQAFQDGVPIVLMRRFDTETFCKTIQDYKVTVVPAVPPIFVNLLRHPAMTTYNLSSVRVFISGAAPLSRSVLTEASVRLKEAGCSAIIIQGYGSTEATGASHFLPLHAANEKVGSVGILFHNIEARLVKTDATDAALGEPGELWLRGPIIMKGYLNNAQATRDAITADGFYKTGDVAVVDEDGYFYIVDRVKELIKYKGFQVPPAELESVLLQHPLIADAGVVGVDNVAEATEVPRAYIVHAKGLRSEAEQTKFSEEIQEWVKTQVARHKYLRGGVVVVDAIPKSPSGKILRRELRDRAKRECAFQPVPAKL